MKFLALILPVVFALCAQAAEWHAHYRMTSDEYQSTAEYYVDQGFRIKSVSGYERDGEDNYAAIFEKNDGLTWVSHHRMTSSSYQAKFDKYIADGYRLRQVNGYTVGENVYFAAVWDKSPAPGAWVARHNINAASLQKYTDTYLAQGYRVTHVSAYEVNGEARFAALWEKINDGTGWWAWAKMTSAEYQKKFDAYLKDGYRLINVNGYSIGKTVYYAGIWDTSAASGAWVARHGMDSPTFQSLFDKYKADGYVLQVLSGYNTGTTDRYAALWIKP
ncbi:hypothetical protein BJY01DRAFT_257576 [Aspergillus pseudoustus]|uniref:Uncharacterized protein n=1 Tax=Aspergillus pseudoustus TaxID=1810923 RepID=A0ABR4JIG3_9EURO